MRDREHWDVGGSQCKWLQYWRLQTCRPHIGNIPWVLVSCSIHGKEASHESRQKCLRVVDLMVIPSLLHLLVHKCCRWAELHCSCCHVHEFHKDCFRDTGWFKVAMKQRCHTYIDGLLERKIREQAGYIKGEHGHSILVLLQFTHGFSKREWIWLRTRRIPREQVEIIHSTTWRVYVE